MSHALAADGLTKRYRRTLALDHCSFAIPEGAIVALVGPNGAGKSTLLHCATGLTRPSAGTIRVLGGEPGDRTLPGVGFVAQDAPLYGDFTAGELLTMGDKLNRDFDVAFGRERLPKVGVPLDRRVDRLSGGQRAQMALCLALAKRPRVLLLDEPLASLDPLARREFHSAMVDAVAETPTTVVLSSHLVTDLERVCDHLLVLHAGRVQVFAETDQLLATHKILIGPGGPRRPNIVGVDEVVHATDAQRQSTLLVRTNARRRGHRRARPKRHRRSGGRRGDTGGRPLRPVGTRLLRRLPERPLGRNAAVGPADARRHVLGAPLVARELEHGTHRLAWTQGVSRLRWAATKIGLVSVAVLVMTAIYAGLLNWWITPVMQTSGQRFAYTFFDSHGIVVFGYALFALALGVFAGAVTGRMLPAMATTLVGFLGTRLVVMLAARPRYMRTETRVLPDLGLDVDTMRNDLNGDWIIAAGGGVDAAGRGPNSPTGASEELTIHPASDFWAFQTIETAIFVALAVGLVLATIYWIRRRIA